MSKLCKFFTVLAGLLLLTPVHADDSKTNKLKSPNAEPQPIGLLLPAVQKVRESAAKPTKQANKSMKTKKTKNESKDKMGNFEIQDLMSRHNQAEQTQAKVQRKKNKQQRNTIQKIK